MPFLRKKYDTVSVRLAHAKDQYLERSERLAAKREKNPNPDDVAIELEELERQILKKQVLDLTESLSEIQKQILELELQAEN